MMNLRKLAVAAVCLFGGVAAAQSDRATLTGSVQDTSSAAIPGVSVRVVNSGTNDVQTTTTDAKGNYRIGNLPIGNYTVTFSHKGFKSVDKNSITLLTSQTAQINAELPVGSATEVVQVNTEPPILQTEDAAVSTNLNGEAVTELPLNVQGSRNLSNFMFAYVPGVEGSDYSSHINGSVAFTKEVLIDGTSAISQIGGYISESQPPFEAVQEFQADTAGISADAGRSGGGVFRYEMKSGTNRLHGSLFGFLHSTALDAVGADNKLHAVTDPANAAAYLHKSDWLSDWGGGFGGPIVKDKLFFFAAFERYMQANWSLGANTRTVPTDAMMGLDANGNVTQFADLSPMLTTTNIIGTDPCGNTVYQGNVINPATNCAFVNNQIPTSMISRTSAKILQLYHQYYKPQSSLVTNEAGPAYNPDPWFHNTQSSIKIDYNIRSNQHLNGSFYWDDYPRINADQGGVWSPTAQYGGPMANSYWHNTTAPGGRMSYAFTFSPNLVNTAYATFNRFRNPSFATLQGQHWDSQLGLLNGAGNFPLINFDSGYYFSGANYQNGWNFSPLGSQFNDFYAGNTFIYSDQVAWIKGAHSFKFGAEFRAMQFNSHPDVGTFTGGYPLIFDPVSTAGAWYNYAAGYDNLGNAFASFLLGDVYNATNGLADPAYGRRKAFSVYATDIIKVSPKLTVNLDLRWDYNNPYKEKYGHWSSFVLEDPNPVTGLKGQYEYLTNGSQSFERREQWNNYAPHIGVAYQLTPKTVLRSNFSVFYAPLNMNTYGGIPYQTNGNPGFYVHSEEGQDTQGTFIQWDNGYNPVHSQVKTPDYKQSLMVSIDPRALTPGNTQQYSFGVQRELDSVSKIDINWIQSHSYHLQSGILRANQPTVADMQTYVANGSYCRPGYNGYYGAGGTTQGDPFTCITPFPQAAAAFGQIYSVGSPLGNSDYKALQFSVTRRTNHGLSVQGSYVWSRTHGDVDSDFQELYYTGSLQNIDDLKDEAKGISDFDVTHIVKGFIIYELPFGKGKALFGTAGPFLSGFMGGWSLNGDFHYNTGTPILVHSTNVNPGFNSVYINLVARCSFTKGSPAINQRYLNASCFQNPTAGQLGNGGNFQSQIRNPGLATEDLGLHKGVAFGPEQRYNFVFRIEFFNLFNRAGLAGPNTNFGDTQHFGLITDYAQGPRVGQIGARFTF
jgi:hypothetical protein